MIDGVTVPYEEVEEVRMDESALQFVVEQKPRTSHIQADPPRVYSRPEFDLWREALYPKILPTQSGAAGSSASAVYAASRASEKWVANTSSEAKTTSSEEGDVGLDDNAVDAQPSAAEGGDGLSPLSSMEGIVGQDSDFPDAPPEDSAVVLPPATTNSGDNDFLSRHPSIMRLQERHIPTSALDAPTWHEQELRANAEGIPEESAGPEEGSPDVYRV